MPKIMTPVAAAPKMMYLMAASIGPPPVCLHGDEDIEGVEDNSMAIKMVTSSTLLTININPRALNPGT